MKKLRKLSKKRIKRYNQFFWDWIVPMLFLFFVILMAYEFALQPAFISYSSSCLPKIYEEKYSQSYKTAGTATLMSNGTVNIQIAEGLSKDTRNTVIKHELIHKNQYENNRFVGNCKTLIGKVNHYLGEVEAYVFQNLPDPIYDFIYN